MEGQKLTKKQRKSLAFRQGRRKKPTEADVQEVPEAEQLDDTAPEVDESEVTPQKAAKAEAGKKRKRREDEGTEKEKKRRKSEEGTAVAADAEGEGEAESTKKAKDKQKKRYLLFVGNLPKAVTEEQIAAHFSAVGTPPTIRLRHPAPPKPGQSAPPGKGRPKIFAFLEFTNPSSLQSALKLHRSNLGGKFINVELTVGGGGSGEGRRQKLEQKRKQAAERLKSYAKEGAGEAKAVNKQWKDEQRKERESRPKKDKPRRPAASGVNAIPVG